jgi:HEAT repeat protein
MILTVGFLGPIMFLLAGCQQVDKPVDIESFSDPDPLIRISAMKWAVENQAEQAIGPLVDALGDEEAAVRFFAIGALVKLTGEDYGYDYKANAPSRLQAIERWLAFLKDRVL